MDDSAKKDTISRVIILTLVVSDTMYIGKG